MPIYDMTVSEFWKTEEMELPILANYVRYVCCAPATTAPSESCFSRSGFQVWPSRGRLDPKKLEKISFLQDNLE